MALVSLLPSNSTWYSTTDFSSVTKEAASLLKNHKLQV